MQTTAGFLEERRSFKHGSLLTRERELNKIADKAFIELDGASPYCEEDAVGEWKTSSSFSISITVSVADSSAVPTVEDVLWEELLWEDRVLGLRRLKTRFPIAGSSVCPFLDTRLVPFLIDRDLGRELMFVGLPAVGRPLPRLVVRNPPLFEVGIDPF